jgi:hypothetical protein
MKSLLSAGFMLLLCTQAYAYTYACQWVERMADKKQYQFQALRIAAMLPPDSIPKDLSIDLVERHGSWFIYQTKAPWLELEQCSPLQKGDIQFMPVLLNRQRGHNAVVTGNFLLKVVRKHQLDQVIQRYGFKVITYLPRADSAMVDLREVASYDEFIETLDKDKDVHLLAPILSEPRR